MDGQTPEGMSPGMSAGMSAGTCPFGYGAEARAAPATAETGGAPAARPTAPAPTPAPAKHAIARGLARDKLPELSRGTIAEGADSLPTGRCLCGRVSFQIKRPVEAVFAWHDPVSRRRAGGVALAVMTRATNTRFSGWGHLVHYPLSDREVSAFCRICGTPVLSYYLAPEPMDGMAQISAGALDSTEGLRLAAEISPDQRPAFYAFEGSRREISTEALEAMFTHAPPPVSTPA